MVVVDFSVVMPEVVVAFHAAFLHACHWIENLLVSEHRSSLVGDVLDVAVTFETLVIFE